MGPMGERSRGQLLAYVAAAAVVAVAGFRYLGGGGEEPAVAPVEIEESASGTTAAEGADERGRLYVHVAGAVRDEGLYRVPSGTRVGAAIDRAGGTAPAAELSGVNLAAELQDGQQVVVPKRGDVAAPTAASAGSVATASRAGTASAAGGASVAPISLAQATPEQLDASIDGIGPVLAAAIIEYRDGKGSVSSIEELSEVDGIGEERLATLREALVP